jgi:hypothetical protein
MHWWRRWTPGVCALGALLAQILESQCTLCCTNVLGQWHLRIHTYGEEEDTYTYRKNKYKIKIHTAQHSTNVPGHTLTFEDSFEDTYIRWGGGYLHIWYTVTLQHKCTRTYSANVEHKCTRTFSFKKTNASDFGDILVLFLVFFSSVIFYFCTSGSCRLFWKVSWYWHCSVNVLGHWLLRFFFQRFCTSGIRRWSTGTWSLRICSSRVTAALRFEKQNKINK